MPVASFSFKIPEMSHGTFEAKISFFKSIDRVPTARVHQNSFYLGTGGEKFNLPDIIGKRPTSRAQKSFIISDVLRLSLRRIMKKGKC